MYERELLCSFSAGMHNAKKQKKKKKKKKQLSLIKKYLNHILHTNPRHRKEEPQKITITIQQEDKVKQPALFFPTKMIAKLERTQSNAKQNLEQTVEGCYFSIKCLVLEMILFFFRRKLDILCLTNCDIIMDFVTLKMGVLIYNRASCNFMWILLPHSYGLLWHVCLFRDKKTIVRVSVYYVR